MESDEITSLETLDVFLKSKDVSQNYKYLTRVPQICKDYPCALGIDEAGRGPVLGPMVYGTAFCPINESMHLMTSIEAADSKALTEEKRDEIFSKICDLRGKMGWAVEVISPNTICNSMLSRSKVSLNEVSMNSAIGLIRDAISAGVNIGHIFVDTVGKPEKYQAYLCSVFPGYKITVAKKADSTYPIVSAASICAKVSRDHALQVWEFREGLQLKMEDFGSGYPGDPVTKNFLKQNADLVFGYPQLVRFSWSTAENALEKDGYLVEVEKPEEPKTPPNNKSITSFFSPCEDVSAKKARHPFFSARGLTSTSQL